MRVVRATRRGSEAEREMKKKEQKKNGSRWNQLGALHSTRLKELEEPKTGTNAKAPDVCRLSVHSFSSNAPYVISLFNANIDIARMKHESEERREARWECGSAHLAPP